MCDQKRNIDLYKKNHMKPTNQIIDKKDQKASKFVMALHEDEEDQKASKFVMALHEDEEDQKASKFVMALHEDEEDQSTRWDNFSQKKIFHLYFLNAEQIINNMYSLVHLEAGNRVNELNFKKQYISVLNKLQGTNFHDKDSVFVDFSEEFGEYLVHCGMANKEDMDKKDFLFTLTEQEYIRNNIIKAMNLIKVINSNLHYLICRVIGTIGCVRKKGYGGGSVSSSIGMIWINPLSRWNFVDYAEAIVHEFIHNVLFLDDMVNSIFPQPDQLTNPDAMVTSTIRKTKRDLDKSFHSAAVATGLMYFYHVLNNTQKRDAFFQPLLKTVLEIKRVNSSYMTERGHQINDDMLHILETMNFNIIDKKLHLSSVFKRLV